MIEETKHRKLELDQDKFEFQKSIADKRIDIKAQQHSLDEKKFAFEEKRFMMEFDQKRESMEATLKQSMEAPRR